MSQQYYIKKWDTAHDELSTVISIERPPKPEPLPKTMKEAFERICLRYTQYIGIYKRMVKCYDHMVHPQKRRLIGRCIEGVIGRIVELRHELVRICISEYARFGPFCSVYKMLPSDFEMELSQTFHFEKMQRIKHRQDLLQYIIANEKKTVDIEYNNQLPKVQIPESISDSIHEKIETMSLDSYRDELQMRQKSVNWKKVQCRFKIFQSRLYVDSTRNTAERFLNLQYGGMSEDLLEEKEQNVVSARIQTARDNEDILIQRTIMATEALRDSGTAISMEQDMKSNIRQWILECREATGSFPDYPDNEIGGSSAIFAKKTPEQLQQAMDAADEKTKAKPKQKAKEKKSKKAELPAGFIMMPSKFLDETLVAVTKEYETYWKDRDESSNFKQEVSQTLIVEKVRENLEVTLRQQIDEQMRNELEILTLAVDKMKFAKPKPKKKPKKAEKRKESKKKKIKDLTPNADIDDLYTELVRNDILKRVPQVSLRNFRGEMNLVTDQENKGQECKPDLGDIRKMLFDIVVLPMSSSTVRAKAPFTKSLLLVGPRGSGKKMLVHAVCNELGANLFDLTAANIRGRYIDADEQVMLMHLVMKVGRILAPSIIFIDDCDLMFTKKLPPEINYNPARMKGNLIKAMKTIAPEDRIMLIGASSKPFNAAKAPLFKLYERIVCLYPPAYPSRYTLWESSIKAMGGLITKYLLISTLAQISKNFTALDIINVTQEVLSSRRIKQQNAKSLNTSEFGHRLSQYNPVLEDELQALDNWMKETPLAKKRVEIQALIEAGKNVFNKV